MAKARDPQFFTVRSKEGGYLGCYWTKTAQDAIDQLVREQAAYQAHFRRGGLKMTSLTATVEPMAKYEITL